MAVTLLPLDILGAIKNNGTVTFRLWLSRAGMSPLFSCTSESEWKDEIEARYALSSSSSAFCWISL